MARTSIAVEDRLFKNALYQQLSTTLSGSLEFTALVKLHDAATGGAYDLVILDTPPAAHAADFLHGPARLNAVFDSSIISLFMGRTTGLGLAALAWKPSMKLVLGALTLLTGSAFVATCNDFFSAIDAIAADIRETNQRAREQLMESTTAFVLVSSFDAAKIQEGRDFQAQLLALGYFLRAVITNRAWPQWAPADSDARDSTCALLKVLDAPALAVLYTSLSDCYLARQPLAAGFPSAVMVPEMDEELIGLGALDRLAARLCPPPDAAKDGAV